MRGPSAKFQPPNDLSLRALISSQLHCASMRNRLRFIWMRTNSSSSMPSAAHRVAPRISHCPATSSSWNPIMHGTSDTRPRNTPVAKKQAYPSPPAKLQHHSTDWPLGNANADACRQQGTERSRPPTQHLTISSGHVAARYLDLSRILGSSDASAFQRPSRLGAQTHHISDIPATRRHRPVLCVLARQVRVNGIALPPVSARTAPCSGKRHGHRPHVIIAMAPCIIMAPTRDGIGATDASAGRHRPTVS
ncbi:hypothetical protein IWZ01DRAFT_233527 [Phyllosticta capitalensis]